MEYIIIGSIAVAVFIFLYLIIKIEKLRNKANALFLEAEKHIDKDKFEYVCNKLYKYIPVTFKWFIDEKFFKKIVQTIYDSSRRIAKDLLDDGKFNKSYK